MRRRRCARWSGCGAWRSPPTRLQRLALALGADVPMCLGGRPAFVGGIGEVIEPAPALPACGLVLVNPRSALPTPKVFALRTGAFSAPARFAAPPADARALAACLAARRNDLTAAAVALVPAVAEVLAALAAAPGVLLARMSGSGATCFGLCDDAARPGRRRRGWQTPPGLVDHLGRRGCGRYRRRAGRRCGRRCEPPHFPVSSPPAVGASPSGKAPVFGTGIRRFESSRPSHVRQER